MSLCRPASAQPLLAEGFMHPQDTARTKVWWFHGETLGTHEGITADLEAFRQQGVGGVVYYDQVHGNGEGAFATFSPEWWDELIFSAQEARRLGLSFEVNASNGYVAGGRWVTPDKSMQRLAHTQQVVETEGGTTQFQLTLPARRPADWHRDVAVMAIPYEEDLLGEAEMVNGQWSMVNGQRFTARSITYEATAQGKARTSSMQVPATHFTLNPKLPDVNPKQFYGCGFTELPMIGELQASDDGVIYDKVCDLRPRYRNLGGVAEQTVSFPAVTARYFRIVMSQADVKLSQVALSACAKVDAWQEKASLVSELMSSDRTPRYRTDELADFSKAIDLTAMMDGKGRVTWTDAPRGRWLVLRFMALSTGGHAKHGRKDALGLECDKLSVEGARLQWRSYVKPIIDSIRVHGATVEGVCMDSHEAGPQNWTEGLEQEFRTLRGYDMRRYLPVMAGFVVDNPEQSARFLYDLRHTINDLITERYYGEFNRLCHSEALTLTAQAIGGALCMAGDAISVKKSVDKPQAEFWGYQTEGNYDIKDCSSAAHIYGKQIASGEAFTDITYKHTLADVKNLFDYALAYGINEFVVCAVAYQPWLDHRLNTANGRQYVLNRHNTFWPLSRPFWDYQARCSWLMRQGKPVSDVCVYLGDDIPARILAHEVPDLPQGYDFDAFTTDALLHRMTAHDGRIHLPDGISYRVMVLPASDTLTATARQQVEQFRRQGVVVYDPQTDTRPLTDILAQAGLTPDVDAPHCRQLYFAHRRTAQADIYFLNNHSDHTLNDRLCFRTYAASAELWDAVTGHITPLPFTPTSQGTAIQLSLAPRQSLFVVLKHHADTADNVADSREAHATAASIPLSGSWLATFDPQQGGPSETVTLPATFDLTKHPDTRLRYYSGTTSLSQTFRLARHHKRARYLLNLQLLGNAAEVVVNGHSAGIVWCSPYHIDISRLLKKGRNTIELRLANSLWNRLVGDARSDEDNRIYWQTHPLAKPTDTLVPSGISKAELIVMP